MFLKFKLSLLISIFHNEEGNHRFNFQENDGAFSFLYIVLMDEFLFINRGLVKKEPNKLYKIKYFYYTYQIFNVGWYLQIIALHH